MPSRAVVFPVLTHPARVRTHALRGRTPVLRVCLTRDRLSAISASTSAGKRSLHAGEHALRGPDVVRFLRHRLDHLPGRLLVIWDGSPIHRAQVVTDCLAGGAARRRRLEPLPGDAPDLHPDAGVWRYLTRGELANVCCRDLPHLRRALRAAAMRLRRTPRGIRGGIRQAGDHVEQRRQGAGTTRGAAVGSSPVWRQVESTTPRDAQ